jgi:hypothetical protein
MATFADRAKMIGSPFHQAQVIRDGFNNTEQLVLKEEPRQKNRSEVTNIKIRSI